MGRGAEVKETHKTCVVGKINVFLKKLVRRKNKGGFEKVSQG